MNGWMGELLFFVELLATSSLSDLFAEAPVLSAATYLGYFRCDLPPS
jgi:hypothetical protein